jgi:hypothetical protein
MAYISSVKFKIFFKKFRVNFFDTPLPLYIAPRKPFSTFFHFCAKFPKIFLTVLNNFGFRVHWSYYSAEAGRRLSECCRCSSDPVRNGRIRRAKLSAKMAQLTDRLTGAKAQNGTIKSIISRPKPQVNI